jgi:hypothetical protein
MFEVLLKLIKSLDKKLDKCFHGSVTIYFQNGKVQDVNVTYHIRPCDLE